MIDVFWKLYECSYPDNDESHITQLRKLFLATADSMPTILLAKAMVRFAFVFPSQASYMEPLIVDLIKDSVLTEDWQSLEHGLRDFWDDEKTTGLPPFANVILLCLWKVIQAKPPEGDPSNRISALRPVRSLVLKLIEVTESEVESHLDEYAMWSLAGQIVLCKEAHILGDGFAEFLTKHACRSHYLETWEAIQSHLPRSIKPENLEHPLGTCSCPPLRIRVDYDLEQDEPETTRNLRIVVTDPHDFEATNHFIGTDVTEGTGNRIYDSHQDRHSPEICFVRQEGSELFFDCSISDKFSHEDLWEDERRRLVQLDRDLEYYTYEEDKAGLKEGEVAEATTNDMHSEREDERQGLVSRLALEGLSLIAGIV